MRYGRARGMTLIEVLVCITIVGTLAAMALPAVTAGLESARRSRCGNNLRQIGVALHSYHAAHNCFPQEINYYRRSDVLPSAPGPLKYYSAFVRLLPFLEQQTLYAGVNFDVEYYPGFAPLNAANQTVFDTTIAVFLCPSDGSPFPGTHGNNYRGNSGLGPSWSTTAVTPDSGNGFLAFPETLNAGSFPDGLAHTAAYSERLRGSGRTDGSGIAERDFGDLSIYPAAIETGADRALQWCRAAARVRFPGLTDSGYSWFMSSRETTIYCHAQEPNGPIPDCLLPGSSSTFGIASARSWHRGGANVLMGDGSLRLASDSIQRGVWRALGTRNGGELVE